MISELRNNIRNDRKEERNDWKGQPIPGNDRMSSENKAKSQALVQRTQQ